MQPEMSESDPSLSPNKRAVAAYVEGFRTGDHDAILSLLTEDVVWEMPGDFSITGKAAFDKEIENDTFTGKPTLTVIRMVEENDVVVLLGTVEARFTDGGELHGIFSDYFHLREGLIRRIESYQVDNR
ncbi:nuclear transport factor 2 family protein [Rhodococcus sp. Q]|uniref:nuclear transport factor 2 family protein n=1 Tax=Rhodococcus sp. Q TaxID=2502252 RepID=UPI0010F76DB7|nr:nuclear transport factor 2 family protein [Rhodococcus sp. Q]